MATIYRSLDRSRKEIRILTSIELVNQQVCCQLESVALDENVYYKTISWCWGDQNQVSQILVNGEPVIVRGNAEKLLRWLQKTDHRRIWLDAVCINQFDLHERSNQVTLMHEIYGKSAQTLVILDLDANKIASAAVYKAIEVVLNHAKQECGDLKNIAMLLANGTKHSELPLPELHWAAICALFASPWFTRIWIVQEIILSRDALCCFGTATIPWQDVRNAAGWLQYHSYWKYLYTHPGTIGIDNCTLISRNASLLGRNDTWYIFVSISRMFKSTDPRDKLYALLGLRHNYERSIPIIPDYTKSIVEVYIQVSRAIIKEYESLHVILSANSLDPLQGVYKGDFPSWVPRFDYWFVRSASSYRVIQMNSLKFGAANKLKAKVHPSSGKILAVDGVVVDTVAATSKPLTVKLIDDLKLFIDQMWYIWDVAQVALQLRPQNLRKTVMETLTIGCLGNENGLPEEVMFKEFVGFLGALGLDGAEASLDAFHSFKQSIWLWSVNRVFYVTETGYIGMGPREAAVGDTLAVLFGSRAPCVLRSYDKGKYTFVGDTFVRDIMEGEFIRDFQSQSALEDKTIRFNIG